MKFHIDQSVSDLNRGKVMKWEAAISNGYPLTGETRVTIKQEADQGRDVIVVIIHDAMSASTVTLRFRPDDTPNEVQQKCHLAFGKNH
jgi:hypothetical protein